MADDLSAAPSAPRVVAAIVGPTGAGKTAIAHALARSANAILISADSRQVYTGFDIGTAKPTSVERATIDYRGIDVADPTERYGAARWATDALTWLDDADRDGRPAICVGGTGLYLRALTAPLFDEPRLDTARRAQLDGVLAGLDTETLRRWVQALDPARAALGRTQLLRAIEVALLSGERISDLFASRARPSPLSLRYLLVDPGPVLAERLAARTDAMLSAGWGEEVQGLVARLPADAPAWLATGYDAIRRWMAGDLTQHAAREAIVIATRQYAKRQRTWFRHQLSADAVTMLDPTRGDAIVRAHEWLASVGGIAA